MSRVATFNDCEEAAKAKEEGCKSMKIGRATQVTVRCKIEGKLGERKNNDATRMTGSNSS